MGVDDKTPDEHDDSPVEVFLSQPSYNAEEDIPSVKPAEYRVSTPGGAWRRAWSGFERFMFDKRRSEYSSIAPRKADGTRSKIFFFNGNGRGR